MSYQDRDTYGMHRNNHGDGPGPRLMGANTLIGDDVYNHKNEKLGNIKEIMINTYSGKVCYAVLSRGGVLSIGEKLFAVPWKALSLDAESKRFLLDVEISKVENSPGFNTDHWPNMADETWASSVHDYYDIEYVHANF